MRIDVFMKGLDRSKTLHNLMFIIIIGIFTENFKLTNPFIIPKYEGHPSIQLGKCLLNLHHVDFHPGLHVM